MLLLCISLLSCCFFGSMGSATEEFQENFKALVGLTSEKILLPVPAKKFQCKHVPCQLQKTVKKLKASFENDQIRKHISWMEKNMHHIISTLNKAHMKPEESSCPVKEELLQRALQSYQRFFQKLHENC